MVLLLMRHEIHYSAIKSMETRFSMSAKHLHLQVSLIEAHAVSIMLGLIASIQEMVLTIEEEILSAVLLHLEEVGPFPCRCSLYHYFTTALFTCSYDFSSLFHDESVAIELVVSPMCNKSISIILSSMRILFIIPQTNPLPSNPGKSSFRSRSPHDCDSMCSPELNRFL